MSWNFQEIRRKAQQEIEEISDDKSLEAFRVKYLGRKGLVPEIYSSLATLPKQEKPTVGKAVNELKNLPTGEVYDIPALLTNLQS